MLRTALLASLLPLFASGCYCVHESPVDGGALVADGGTCASIPPELQGCASCHAERSNLAGWYARPDRAALDSDTWGRRAFYVLFTQANSREIPEHTAPYEWAEQCFCQSREAEPWRCYTLAGEFEAP